MMELGKILLGTASFMGLIWLYIKAFGGSRRDSLAKSHRSASQWAAG